MRNGTTRRRRTIAGALAGAMALSAAPIIGLGSPAFAADEPPPVADPIGAGNVCEGAPDEEPFTDVTSSDPSYDEIVCLVQAGITKGTSATTYSPAGTLTRRQMAVFLKRIADLANENEAPGAELEDLPPYDNVDDYPDVATERQEVKVAVDQLSQVEIARGFEDGTYRPNATLKRRQMAKFIVRELEFLTGDDLPAPSGDYFDDDEGDSGEEEFNKLAEQGVFIGNGAGTVNPGGDLSRRQMANILLRTLQVLFDDGLITGLFGPDHVPAAASVRPELLSASIVDTNDSGTRIRFVFDEEITGTTAPVAPNFHAYSQDGEQFDGSGPPVIDTSGTTANRSVVVTFTGVSTLGDAAALTVATVDFGAVQDNEGSLSPIGDAPLTRVNPAPGRTSAPDLSTVQGYTPVTGDATLTEVDFVFDEPAWVVNDAGFFLVSVGGALIECTATEGDGTITITAQCEENGTTNDIDAADVARGFVAAGAVSDAEPPPLPVPTGNANPLQATETPDAASTTPDLVSASLVFNPDQQSETTDAVVYTFDQDVAFPTGLTAAQVGARFRAYDVNGDEVTGSSAARADNLRQVTVTFADTALDEAVGASVSAGAVRARGTDLLNHPDEEPVTNNRWATSSGRAGETDNPDLDEVTISASTTAPVVTYVFDEDVNLVGAGDEKFYLVLANGMRLVCNDGEATNPTEETADQTVTCDTFSVADADGAPTNDSATAAEVRSAVAGSVDDDAVIGEDDSLETQFPLTGDTAFGNPEGAELTSGGTGTPQQ